MLVISTESVYSFTLLPTYVPKHVEEMNDYTDVFVVCAFFLLSQTNMCSYILESKSVVL
jgi:hypothetical protein